jgi:hypothetical protein
VRNTDIYVGSIAVYRARRSKEKQNEGTGTDIEEISGWKRKKEVALKALVTDVVVELVEFLFLIRKVPSSNIATKASNRD